MIKRLISTGVIFAAAAFGQNGTLNVTVKDYKGSLLSAARVTITSLPIYNRSATSTVLPHYNATATTASTGVASFAPVPAGAYAVCAYPTGQQTVDSCSWVARPQSAVVTASGSTTFTVQLQQAARVTVVLNDAQQVLATAAVGTRQLQLGVGVLGGHWQPLRRDLIAATSQSLSALVPVNTQLQLTVGAYGFRVADSLGNLLKSNSSQSHVLFTVPATGTVPTLQLNVLGTL
jgi:hypothetical protein